MVCFRQSMAPLYTVGIGDVHVGDSNEAVGDRVGTILGS